jgi:hypothetical protein
VDLTKTTLAFGSFSAKFCGSRLEKSGGIYLNYGNSK